MRIGVIGLGGLGHLALQYARAFGCEVTAFSASPAQEAEARRLGAHSLVDFRDAAATGGAVNSFDFLISTAPGDINWPAHLNALGPKLESSARPRNPPHDRALSDGPGRRGAHPREKEPGALPRGGELSHSTRKVWRVSNSCAPTPSRVFSTIVYSPLVMSGVSCRLSMPGTYRLG